MFWLKKLIGTLLMPLPFALFLILIGLLFLWLRRKKTLGALCIILAFVELALLGTQPVSNLLLRPLEQQYPAFVQQANPLSYILVLGAGHVSDPNIPALSRSSDASRARVMEAVQIWRNNPQAKIILSGAAFSDPVSEAKINANMAHSLGVPRSQLILFENNKDTAEEALHIAPMIQGQPTALVTSASHMPRAIQMFHHAGVKPIPAPTWYLAKQAPYPLPLWDKLPDARFLYRSRVAIHEWIGIVWLDITQLFHRGNNLFHSVTTGSI
ncbi:envelope biogenesis factor ElyC [Dongshaea marina]|uniref:envelope biogenesis factor ElyC n=1 Tax=Dongshaea marina TaxID=2047966 RepID=UPI000D3E9A30|nr:envelope biogenesis factor ElyC [Dongshaea marina]